ncbi:hypothetical protein DYQ93_11405 [Xanthomonas sp. LMG 8992]|uniref:hypothetical protein n=1 Tax=Xanthomonas sp. LMG 8992 TaxID=1591157 RepID=UPI001370AB95|nr:hypothetical protein [Xanthomonas sp. LMG 8992]MXV11626.1 hypothetical protein [Xanthomonas sp. LMG 8992]
MDTNEIAEVANLPIPELRERLGDFDAADLQALRAYEADPATGQNRKGALEAIDERLSALAPDGGRSSTASDTAGDAAPAAEAAPAWQEPDYDGPITIPQAAWRNANLKPAIATATKPVAALVTKQPGGTRAK